MSTKIRRFFTLSLTIRSPFLFAGLRNEVLGVDAAHLRDEDGTPIIPADQIRGVLRAACDVLSERSTVLSPADHAALFGDESRPNEQEQNVPNRGCLHISDAMADLTKDETLKSLTRIEIEDDTGAVKKGALLVIELAAPLGQEVTFTGTLSFDWPKDRADDLEKALDSAFKLIPAIGAYKSAGFGEVMEIKLEVQKQDQPWQFPPKTQASPSQDERRAYTVTFDRPILVDSKRISDNVFEGSAIIPGAAFKGALAEALKRCGEKPEEGKLAEALSKLRISHAIPAAISGNKQDIYGLNVPCSVMAAKGGAVFKDILLHDEPSSENLLLEGETPAFPIDWKGKFFNKFTEKGHFPQSEEPKLLPRVHVAIDAETLVAAESQLFTTLARSVSKHRWNLIVDTSGVTDKTIAAQLVALLEQGLDPIGRTGAMAKFTPCPNKPDTPPFLKKLRSASPPNAEPVKQGSNLYAITLITPAMLVDAQKVAKRDNPRITFDDYKRYWENAVCGKLIRAFTTAQMAGGYIATRRRLYGKTYYPFILTDPGSVFLIENPDLEKLKHALRHGLMPAAQTGGAAITWKNCPYVPENGYGEIFCNLVKHATLNNEKEG